MLSVKAIYENGKILLKEPVELADNTEVIITFLDNNSSPDCLSDGEVISVKDDAYYEKLREHKRFQAKGNISIVDGENEIDYPLNDYSAGGLSFFSNREFNVMEIITAKVKYHAAGEVLELDFEIRVMRCIEQDAKYMVGCQFLDNADEELWHTIMN